VAVELVAIKELIDEKKEPKQEEEEKKEKKEEEEEEKEDSEEALKKAREWDDFKDGKGSLHVNVCWGIITVQ